MSERELSNPRGVGERLIAGVASYVAGEIFYLVVPTDGANYCLLDSHSHRVVKALTWQ